MPGVFHLAAGVCSKATSAFNEGSPRAVDSMRAYVADFPDDLEGWYTYAEALHHLRDLVPNTPDTIIAAFDRVIAGDSTLTPALVHPLELTLTLPGQRRLPALSAAVRSNRAAAPGRRPSYRRADRVGAAAQRQRDPLGVGHLP